MAGRAWLDRSYSTPTPEKGTAHIKLGHGRYAVVDADRYDELSAFSWSLHDQGYAITNVATPEGPRRYKTVRMHQLVMPGHTFLEHIDGDKLNNRASNLRPCRRSTGHLFRPDR